MQTQLGQHTAHGDESDLPAALTREIVDNINEIATHPKEIREKLERATHGQHLLNLDDLDINDNDIEGYIIPFLKRSPNITHLTLKGTNYVYSDGLKWLAEIETLRMIDLTRNPIMSNQIGRSPYVNIKEDNKPPDNLCGLKAVAASKTLQILILDETDLTDEACTILASNTSLKSLSIKETSVTKQGFEVLKASSINLVDSEYGLDDKEQRLLIKVEEVKAQPHSKIS